MRSQIIASLRAVLHQSLRSSLTLPAAVVVLAVGLISLPAHLEPLSAQEPKRFDAPDLVGLAVRGPKKAVDKAVKGLALHA